MDEVHTRARIDPDTIKDMIVEIRTQRQEDCVAALVSIDGVADVVKGLCWSHGLTFVDFVDNIKVYHEGCEVHLICDLRAFSDIYYRTSEYQEMSDEELIEELMSALAKYVFRSADRVIDWDAVYIEGAKENGLAYSTGGLVVYTGANHDVDPKDLVPLDFKRVCRTALELADERGCTPSECFADTCDLNGYEYKDVTDHLQRLADVMFPTHDDVRTRPTVI